MRSLRRLNAAVLALLTALPAHAQNVDLSTVPKRDAVQLTIYNSEDITLVRETRVVTFKKGANPLQFSWANTLIDPSSGFETGTFVMEAFDDANALVDSATVQTRLFAPLEVSFAPGIRRVLLMRTAGSEAAGTEFDDLSFFPIPEPSAFTIAATSLFALSAIGRRRSR